MVVTVVISDFSFDVSDSFLSPQLPSRQAAANIEKMYFSFISFLSEFIFLLYIITCNLINSKGQGDIYAVFLFMPRKKVAFY